MQELQKNLQLVLPIEISFISWDETILVISGDKWSFSTQSAWRLIDITNNKVIAACWDDNVLSELEKLKNTSIESIDYQSKKICVDPFFYLSNGVGLEIFSTDTIEPWVFSLPSGEAYIG